jgi:large conductance mechanosensitive channel
LVSSLLEGVLNMLKGFKEFIMRGNVVDLAIAVVIGTAFTALVKAFVADILTPIIAAIFGKPNFGDLTFSINNSQFLYGDLINVAITFVSVAAAIYFFVVLPLNKIAERRAKGLEPADEVPPDIALLTEIRDLLASRDGAAPSA